MAQLIPPYGGKLVELLIAEEEARREWTAKAESLPSLQLSPRSVCDLELLATGAFSPLDRFMGEADYRQVLLEMRLADGTLFPVPITLPVLDDLPVRPTGQVTLRSARHELLAVMTVEERFRRDCDEEARHVCGTTDLRHPLIAEMASWGPWYLSGTLKVLNVPRHYSFADLRRTPAEVRLLLEGMGRSNVVAFQARHPIHRAHEELTKRAAAQVDGSLLVHPAVGLTRPGDVDFYMRVRCYKALVARYYDPRRTVLSLLPLAMRMVGPREAVWHAIIRRNYGANYFIVDRDHAGPGHDSTGKPVYGSYDAQELLAEYEREVGIKVVPFQEMVYLPDEDRYEELSRVKGRRYVSLSETEVRDDYLAKGKPLPEWFTRPEVASILSANFVPRQRQGFCVWLTGLAGAGKSTIAEIFAVRLMEHGRQVTLLDGDVVRTHLSKGLGFSKEDRDTNIMRIGFVASEIVRHNGAVICAAISPYRAARNQVRAMVGDDRFMLVYVATPLDVCEQRDTKGLYVRARRGELKGVTGIDDPYEEPVGPELVLDTVGRAAEENAQEIVRYLAERGFLRHAGCGAENT